MANRRKNEKVGWILGWSGGFFWVLILAVVLLLRGDILNALIGVVLTLAAVAAIVMLAPWRYPEQPYWKLMLPVYGLFFLSLTWAMRLAGGFDRLGVGTWLILPLFLPLYLAGSRRWIEGEKNNLSSKEEHNE